MFSVRLRLVDSLDSHQRRFPFPRSFSTQMQLCWREPMAQTTIAYLERTMTQKTIAYLEQRYAALESEIADALRQSPTDDLTIAPLTVLALFFDVERRMRTTEDRQLSTYQTWHDRETASGQISNWLCWREDAICSEKSHLQQVIMK
jgi:hypothetical protein